MRIINIPKYVRRILKRSEFAFFQGCEPGYTIRVPKHSIYAQAGTLRDEIEKTINWAKRCMGFDYNWKTCPVIIIREMPQETTYSKQYAVIDIYDPLMQQIEYLISR